MRYVYAGFIVLSLAAVGRCGAQTVGIVPGMRVRVSTDALASVLEGVVGNKRGDTLSVVRAGAPPFDLPLSAATRIDVSQGRSRLDGAKRGLLWGTGIGVVLGALNAFVQSQRASDSACTGALCDAAPGAIVANTTVGGAALGAAIGAILGRERWKQVSPLMEIKRSGSRIVPGEVRLGMQVRF